MKNCYGCGVKLQFTNPNEIGYISKNTNNQWYCQRCFKITNYNQNQIINIKNFQEDWNKSFKKINWQENIFYVVDITNFFASFIYHLHQQLKNSNTYLIVNKIDKILALISENKIRIWIEKQLKRINLNVKKIILISATKNFHLEEIKNIILNSKKDSYFIGNVNSGKSTLINNLKKNNNNLQKVTTSYYPSTTIDLIKIPFNQNQNLYDTPGYINHEQLFYYINNEDLRLFHHHKKIKATTYQLNEQQTILIANLIQFNFINGPKTSFHFYLPNNIGLHRTKYAAGETIWNQQNFKPKLIANTELVSEEIIFDNLNELIGLEIAGLGWISFKTHGQTITIKKPKAVKIIIINPIL